MNNVIDHYFLLGVRIDNIDQKRIIDYLICNVRENKRKLLSYVNVHALNIAYKDYKFRDYINSSDLVFCDGYGVKWAANLVEHVHLSRMTPTDWFSVLVKECAEKGISFYFLGAKEGVARKTANDLLVKNPGLIVAGSYHGYFDKQKTSEENKKVIKEINSLKPDILVVGFGMPDQEKWIHENWEGLDIKVALPVGALFDYLSGEVYRAPAWMTDHGLEWLGRLLAEPRRLWKRYLLGNPQFIWRLFVHYVLGLKLPVEDS